MPLRRHQAPRRNRNHLFSIPPCVRYTGHVNATSTAAWLDTLARYAGFAAVGVATVEPMDPTPLRAWLDAGYGAEMTFLARHLPLRADLRAVLPGTRSVFCVALAYPKSPDSMVAGYARCLDYHEVMRARLSLLWEKVIRAHPEAQGNLFVDSGPLPERELARRAGIGWVGRHGCLIHPRYGSRIVLGEILTTLALPPTSPVAGDCGACRRCLDACPTGALVTPGIIDVRRCLSYLTIEHGGAISRALREQQGTRLFGCDACQDACPYNATAVLPEIGVLPPAPPLPGPIELLTMPAEALTRLLRGRAQRRAKRSGLLRNACVALGNQGDPAAIPALAQALRDAQPLIRAHAAWALGRLGAENHLADALTAETDETVCEEIAAALNASG